MKLLRKRSKKAGLPPGSLVHIGDDKKHSITIQLMSWGSGQEAVEKTVTVDEISTQTRARTEWIHVDGIHDMALISGLGQKLGIPPMVLEDIVNTEQRPKLNEAPPYLLVITKMLTFVDATQTVRAEQATILLGNNRVISFVEDPGDVFDSVRTRMHSDRLKDKGADYLFYMLLDAIVDNYFDVIEKIGDQIEVLDTEIINHPHEGCMKGVHQLKKEIILLRKNIWPMREIVGDLSRGDWTGITEKTRDFLQDVHDHTLFIADSLESFRDILSGLLDAYLTSLSYRMNEVIKVLTIISTIFMPLTFIVGVYGMNFKHMPEIDWHYGYAFAWSIMIAATGGMLYYFKRKKWI